MGSGISDWRAGIRTWEVKRGNCAWELAPRLNYRPRLRRRVKPPTSAAPARPATAPITPLRQFNPPAAFAVRFAGENAVSIPTDDAGSFKRADARSSARGDAGSSDGYRI